MKRFLVLAATLAGFSGPLRAENVEFIRVEEDAKAARLQTAVTRYEKNGATVDLIGAVHIGDKAYYDALNKRFESYEVLLFEMIGGENIKPGPPPEPDPEDKAEAKKPWSNPLRLIYDRTAKALKLTGQVDHIDYHAKNFLHADLTAREFAEMQAERGESILDFALSTQDGAIPPNPVGFVLGLVAGRADLLKLSVIHTLGGGDDQIASLAGDNVIIGDRNVRCLEVLDREIAAGRRNIGIFYGAAHFPDMEKRLLELGFTRGPQEWMTAWNVLKPIKKEPAAPAPPP